ncbi:GntR family transcriptional regulator [Fictibacillus macauensis ZFHKF-1]|uniref:GntR family transcriptional regulator n=1 Tax=Fictibacillus macauensis ZFHKF-1 TaxID=1196324 RepID=I8AFA8_9BACL|nr:GntR family transcriptional regulator [Fictibacillus macauensis]EIT84317.1 GntR family transcriptional regulator [Fictibacillus macauensis ZFHKF-1]
MSQMDGEGRPLFLQIAERIENDIMEEVLKEEEQVPSTNQFAVFYRINPATAAKGVNILVDQNILYKKRGIGMFVMTGAREQLLKKRKAEFYERYVVAMIQEAEKIGITLDQLVTMVAKGAK